MDRPGRIRGVSLAKQEGWLWLGIDIHGWVEVRVPSAVPDKQTWLGMTRIAYFVDRNYGMFGGLFGHRNGYGFRPIAADRGFPPDASNEAWEYYEPGCVAPTWITWAEIRDIDWAEQALEPDSVNRQARQEMRDDSWDFLFQVMELFSRRFGADGVRLVVWFDSE